MTRGRGSRGFGCVQSPADAPPAPIADPDPAATILGAARTLVVTRESLWPFGPSRAKWAKWSPWNLDRPRRGGAARPAGIAELSVRSGQPVNREVATSAQVGAAWSVGLIVTVPSPSALTPAWVVAPVSVGPT